MEILLKTIYCILFEFILLVSVIQFLRDANSLFRYLFIYYQQRYYRYQMSGYMMTKKNTTAIFFVSNLPCWIRQGDYLIVNAFYLVSLISKKTYVTCGLQIILPLVQFVYHLWQKLHTVHSMLNEKQESCEYQFLSI